MTVSLEIQEIQNRTVTDEIDDVPCLFQTAKNECVIKAAFMNRKLECTHTCSCSYEPII